MIELVTGELIDLFCHDMLFLICSMRGHESPGAMLTNKPKPMN
jgi:hypothetical protein